MKSSRPNKHQCPWCSTGDLSRQEWSKTKERPRKGSSWQKREGYNKRVGEEKKQSSDVNLGDSLVSDQREWLTEKKSRRRSYSLKVGLYLGRRELMALFKKKPPINTKTLCSNSETDRLHLWRTGSAEELPNVPVSRRPTTGVRPMDRKLPS